jgi:hypothetical protein
MRLVLLVFSGFLISAATHAQEENVSISVTTVEDHPMVVVSNMHHLPVEGFLVTVDTVATNKPLARIYYDVYLNYKHDVPIPPDTSKQVPLPHIVGQDLPIPTLRAVVFSDGTSLGDGAWVQELLHMRKILSGRIEEVMALLQDASDNHLTREQTLDALQKARQASRDATPNATVEERVRQDQAFYMAIRNLQGNPRANGKVPETSATLKHLNHALSLWLTDLQAAKPSLRPRAGGTKVN